jgi:hypothetical protein
MWLDHYVGGWSAPRVARSPDPPRTRRTLHWRAPCKRRSQLRFGCNQRPEQAHARCVRTPLGVALRGAAACCVHRNLPVSTTPRRLHASTTHACIRPEAPAMNTTPSVADDATRHALSVGRAARRTTTAMPARQSMVHLRTSRLVRAESRRRCGQGRAQSRRRCGQGRAQSRRRCGQGRVSGRVHPSMTNDAEHRSTVGLSVSNAAQPRRRCIVAARS